MTIDRRMLLAGILTLPLGASLARAEAPLGCTKSELTEDGLHNQPWFIQGSFLDLKEEMETARGEGKRFVIFVEQKGCPYCKEMHEVHLQAPDVCNVIRKNFAVLQIDLRGSREVTDFDGETLPENRWARKHGINFTPTVVFYEEKDGKVREVLRMLGFTLRDVDGKVLKEAVRPTDKFMEMFRYVQADGYAKGTFRDWLKQQGRG